jgi:hypothetical protein
VLGLEQASPPLSLSPGKIDEKIINSWDRFDSEKTKKELTFLRRRSHKKQGRGSV